MVQQSSADYFWVIFEGPRVLPESEPRRKWVSVSVSPPVKKKFVPDPEKNCYFPKNPEITKRRIFWTRFTSSDAIFFLPLLWRLQIIFWSSGECYKTLFLGGGHEQVYENCLNIIKRVFLKWHRDTKNWQTWLKYQVNNAWTFSIQTRISLLVCSLFAEKIPF